MTEVNRFKECWRLGGSPGYMRPLVISACADEGEHFSLEFFQSKQSGDILEMLPKWSDSWRKLEHRNVPV